MIIIGITGGVGAGKSEILSHLEQQYGAYVIQADQVGHLVMEPGGDAYEEIVQAFGSKAFSSVNILRPDGTIDRKILGGIVFAEKAKLETLNTIVHPAVKRWISRKIEEKRQQGCPLLIIEAALLIEDHYDEICQELWYIHTDARVRRERLKASRGYSDEKIDSILRNQLSEDAFRGACQEVIDNSGSFLKTCEQIKALFLKHGWISRESKTE